MDKPEPGGIGRFGLTPELEQPYPLARHFRRRLLPILVAFLVIVLAVVGISIREATRSVYLERAIHTADIIVSEVSRREPQLWSGLISGQRLTPPEHTRLRQAVAGKLVEYQLLAIKIYDLDRRTLYSADVSEIGMIETVAPLVEVIAENEPIGQRHTEPDGSAVLELYLPYRQDGRLVAVLELYEPLTGGLAATARNIVIPATLLLAALLTLMLVLFAPFVRRAQRAINVRTAAIVEMRQRIERLVSRHAVATMRQAGDGDRPHNERITLTLLYSDARSFTAFSEAHSPERVIEVLNVLIGLQMDVIESHGGDVDKIIGDAVFARFDGADRERRAIAAAVAIQERMLKSGLPLGIGIGVFSGYVVAGLIGNQDRLDYTVIGDSVNISARLSDEAAAGEIIADAATVASAGCEGFGSASEIQLDGREQTLRVQRRLIGVGLQ